MQAPAGGIQPRGTLFPVLDPKHYRRRISPKVRIRPGFLLSITLIQASSERAMKEIPVSTTLSTGWLIRNQLQAHREAHRGFW